MFFWIILEESTLLSPWQAYIHLIKVAFHIGKSHVPTYVVLPLLWLVSLISALDAPAGAYTLLYVVDFMGLEHSRTLFGYEIKYEIDTLRVIV